MVDAPRTKWKKYRLKMQKTSVWGSQSLPVPLADLLLLFVVSNSATPWTAARQASLSITNSQLTQAHVHWVGDAIQPSHPLSSPSPPTFNLSQHQGLFQWVSSSHQVAKVLEFQLQHQPFQWTPRTDLLQDGLVGSPSSPRDSQESCNTTVQKYQFFGAQLSL